MAIDNRIVGANISKLRSLRGMTQFQLAAALNVSHQAVSKWETGQALPDIQTLLALTQLFGVTMEALLSAEIAPEEEEERKETENTADTESENPFARFVNGLIDEETASAIKNAAGEARKTLIEVSGNFSSRAGEAIESAVQFAQKVGKDIEVHFKASKESNEDEDKREEELGEDEDDFICDPEDDEDEDDEEDDEDVKTSDSSASPPRPAVGFDQLRRVAPFMSREKLSELALRFESVGDLESIIQIAPFLSRSAVQQLMEKCIIKKADGKTLARLAPFAGADALYSLILDNIDQIDWRTLESLAPFLKRPMVDALAEYAISGTLPQEARKAAEAKPKKETVQEAIGNVMSEIGNVVNEIGNVARNIFAPKPDIPKEPDIPREPEVPSAPDIPAAEEIEKVIPVQKEEAPIDKVMLCALETGNWGFIKENAGKIDDQELLSEIALSAVASVAQADSAPILMKIIHRLTEENKNRLFEKVAAESAWELAAALQSFAGEENASVIVKAAAEAEGANREEAYLAVEYYAKIAPKEVIDRITQKAVSEDNWVLISALTDAF